MRIKYHYENEEKRRLFTDCLFGENVEFEGFIKIIKVRSILCERCKYFKSIDDEKREVECMWKDMKNENYKAIS